MRCTASTPSPSVTPATAISDEMEHAATQTLSPMARCRRVARFLPSCAEMTLRLPSEESESTSVPWRWRSGSFRVPSEVRMAPVPDEEGNQHALRGPDPFEFRPL
jgi:hypothetical protein